MLLVPKYPNTNHDLARLMEVLGELVAGQDPLFAAHLVLERCVFYMLVYVDIIYTYIYIAYILYNIHIFYILYMYHWIYIIYIYIAYILYNIQWYNLNDITLVLQIPSIFSGVWAPRTNSKFCQVSEGVWSCSVGSGQLLVPNYGWLSMVPNYGT